MAPRMRLGQIVVSTGDHNQAEVKIRKIPVKFYVEQTVSGFLSTQFESTTTNAEFTMRHHSLLAAWDRIGGLVLAMARRRVCRRRP
jgi:hypothetical protein